ncbi:MAG: hypothetical protein ACRC4W_09595 [Treponemataceae bacterium]
MLRVIKAAQEYAGLIFEVMLSRKWYAENFPHLRGSIEEKTFIIPDDKDLKADFSTVKLKAGILLISERTGESKSKRHGDGAVAACLAVFAIRESGGGYQPMTYEAVTATKRYSKQKREHIA